MNPASIVLTLTNQRIELRTLLGALDRFAGDVGLASEPLARLRIALEEAAVNIIDYAWPNCESHVFRATLCLLGEENGRELCIVLEDDGQPFDPLARPDADLTLPLELRRVGGMGIALFRQLTDSVTYEYRDHHNRLTLRQRLAG